MNKIDKYISDFAQFISDMLNVNAEVLKVNADGEVSKVDVSKIMAKANAEAFKNMIANTEKTINQIKNDSDMSVQNKIYSLSTIILNASIVNIDDMNNLTQEEAKSYLNMIKTARNRFDAIMLTVINNIHNMKDEMAHPKEEDEDLTKLSKEELIERLRRK